MPVTLQVTETSVVLQSASAPGPRGANGIDGIDGIDGVDGLIVEIVAGDGIDVDATDPAHPVVSATGAVVGTVASVVAGAGVSVDDADPANPVVAVVTEYIQDLVGAMATDGTTVNFTYDDPAGTLTAEVQNLAAANIGDFAEAVRDRVGATLVAGTNISITVDDPGDIITIAVTGLTKSSVGLGNVDNTSDLGKPISTATQAALDGKDAAGAAAAAQAYAIQRGNHTGSQLAATVSDFDTQVRTSRLDQMAAPSTSVSLASQKVTSLLAGTAATDAVNLQQLTDAVIGLLDYRGTYNASVNTFPASGGSGVAGAVLKADFWVTSVQGTLGGQVTWPGDFIVALVDAPGQTAANWDIIEHDLGYAPEDVANKSNDGTMAGDSATLYPTQHAAKTYADTASAAKVADAIADGVTAVAPSQNAVFDALALKQATAGHTAESVPVSVAGSLADLAFPASTVFARLASGDIVAATPSQVRTLLALVIGTNVQAWDADLDTLAALTATTDNFIVGVAGAWASRTPAQAMGTAAGEAVIRANTLDQFSPPTGAVAMNAQRITGLANGVVDTDAAAMGQLDDGAYGDGSDGDATYDGIATVLGAAPIGGSGYQLGRDMYFNNLTINSGITVFSSAFHIYVKGVITGPGTVKAGSPFAGGGLIGGVGAPGLAAGPGSVDGGQAGATGVVGVGATTGNRILCLGGRGGSGGAGTSGAGGITGTVTAPGASLGTLRALPYALLGALLNVSTSTWGAVLGGTGGGSGSGDGTNKGGGGGASVGLLIVAARRISTVSPPIFDVSGGAGEDRSGGAGNVGGGGGGGAGHGILLSRDATTTGATFTANGGAGGAKHGTGVAGSAGASGAWYKILA
jgi:hypothetical protein